MFIDKHCSQSSGIMAVLKRSLNLGQCIFFGVGSILGAGIYTIIGKVAGLSGNQLWLAFMIASVTAMLTAFSYAELSAAFPKAGGEYVYVKKAFGNVAGTIIGFIIATNGIISGATVSLGFAGYFIQLIPVPTLIAAISILGLIFLINVTGIKESSTINIVFTIIEAAGLFLVIYAAFPSIGDQNILESTDRGLTGLLLAAALSFYAYIGFEEIVKLAEETKDPEKNIPKALFIANIIVMIVYTLVSISVVSAIPASELAGSEGPLADVVGSRFGATGILIISIIALFSTSNTILSNMLGSSRIILNIAREKKAIKKLSYVSPKRKTPVYSLILVVAVMTAFSTIGDIETVALIANFFIFTTFIFVNLSVIVLRKKQKHIQRPFRVPWNVNDIPIISILGIIFTVILLCFNIINLFQQ